MAITLNALRNQIVTSLYGRDLGLDKDRFPVMKSPRIPVVAATSDTTATALPNYGYATVTTTTNDGWTLTDPIPGVPVTLMTGTTSTGTYTITCAAATIVTSAISTGSIVTITGGGRAAITLVGNTTAQWLVVGTYGAIGIA